MRTYAALVNSSRWVKLSIACGYQTKHRALDDCRATLDAIKRSYKPEFTKLDYEKLRLIKQHEDIDKQIRYYIYQIQELSEKQRNLLGQRQEIEYLLKLDDDMLQTHLDRQQDVAATNDDYFDIPD